MEDTWDILVEAVAQKSFAHTAETMRMVSRMQALEADNANLRRNAQSFEAIQIQSSTIRGELKAKNAEINAMKITHAQEIRELQARSAAIQADLQERLRQGEHPISWFYLSC